MLKKKNNKGISLESIQAMQVGFVTIISEDFTAAARQNLLRPKQPARPSGTSTGEGVGVCNVSTIGNVIPY